MILESQVCSLELVKKLKELGVKQESLFYYIELPYLMNFNQETKEHTVLETTIELRFRRDIHFAREEIINHYSAFTVAELGEMLPDNFTTWVENEKLYRDHFFHEIKVKNEYLIEYSVNDKPHLSQSFKDINEADARAKMLIYLIENNLFNHHTGETK